MATQSFCNANTTGVLSGRAALIASVCITSGTKKQLECTHGVYSFVVFSHSSQNVAQIHIPVSPTQHDLLLDPRYFSTVNLRRREQKLDAGMAHRRVTRCLFGVCD